MTNTKNLKKFFILITGISAIMSLASLLNNSYAIGCTSEGRGYDIYQCVHWNTGDNCERLTKGYDCFTW